MFNAIYVLRETCLLLKQLQIKGRLQAGFQRNTILWKGGQWQCVWETLNGCATNIVSHKGYYKH